MAPRPPPLNQLLLSLLSLSRISILQPTFLPISAMPWTSCIERWVVAAHCVWNQPRRISGLKKESRVCTNCPHTTTWDIPWWQQLALYSGPLSVSRASPPLSPPPAAARHCCTLTTQGVLWLAASLGLLSSVSPGRAREKRSRANVLPTGVSVPLNLKLADLGSVGLSSQHSDLSLPCGPIPGGAIPTVAHGGAQPAGS